MKSIRSTSEAMVALFTLLVALAAGGLAVGAQSWAQTLLLGAVGGLYLFFPPSGLFPRYVLVLTGLLTLLACTAFLPASWFGTTFHQSFEGQGIVLPWTLTPQPWLTFENLTLLLITLLWAWYCLSAKNTFEQREFLATCYLVAMSFVAVNIILTGTSLWDNLPAFAQGAGRFENRNQTGDLLIMGGLLSLVRGLGQISKRKEEGWWWLLLSLVFITAIFRNGSRAAVVLFVIGALLAYVLMPKDKRHHKIILWALLLMMGIGALIFIYEGADLRRRFDSLASGHEGRLPIYRDALQMIVNSPVNGVGLGNFEGVFNIQRGQGGESVMRCIHPESDWLWVGAELGVGGMILLALLIFYTFRNYLRRTPFPALTWACLTIAVVFLLHGLIDVGGHRLGTVWSCLYLVGLGASRTRSRSTDVRFPRLILRLAGVLVLVLVAFRVQSDSLQPWMPTRGSLDRIEQTLQEDPSATEQKLLVDRGLDWAPLSWMLYFQRARLLLDDPDLTGGGDADFNRALYLEQNSIDLPFAIGELCRDADRPEAMVAWQEALRRGARRREELFEHRFSGLSFQELMKLANHDPNLEAMAVVRQGHPDFDPARESFLASNPALEGIRPDLAQKFFDRWLQVGDVDALVDQWPKHGEWRSAGWRAYAEALARNERYTEAVLLVFLELPQPPMPESAANLTVENLNDPDNISNRSDYASYLRAKGLEAAGKDEMAWRVLLPLVREP
jgi:predicted small integral membrane protein